MQLDRKAPLLVPIQGLLAGMVGAIALSTLFAIVRTALGEREESEPGIPGPLHRWPVIHTEGIPILGFTWYSLIDQMDWDVALADERNMVNPIGLYDMNRQPRPVAGAYRQLIQEFANKLSRPGG